MSLGDDYDRAYYNVTVMMSPRDVSTRGKVLGNIAAAGHLYYVCKLDRRVIRKEREKQHYKFRWRSEQLVSLKRKSVEEKEQELRELKSERTANPHARTTRKVRPTKTIRVKKGSSTKRERVRG
jgi:hypothetical protein